MVVKEVHSLSPWVSQIWGGLGQKWLSLPSGTLREAGERLNVILQSKEFGEQGREF